MLGAFWRAGGEGLAGVTSVTISATYLPPPPPTPQPTYDSWSELRGAPPMVSKNWKILSRALEHSY